MAAIKMYRVRTITAGYAGAPGYTTHYFRPSDEDAGAVTSDQAAGCAARVLDAWQASHALYPTAFSFDVQNVVDVIQDTDGALVTSFGVTTGGLDLGTSGAGFGPLAAGIVVSWLTDNIANGHRVRGRTFLVPVAAGGDTNGTPTATELSLAAAFAAGTFPGDTAQPQQVVWHRPKGAAAGLACDITAATVKDTFAVLRSRRP